MKNRTLSLKRMMVYGFYFTPLFDITTLILKYQWLKFKTEVFYRTRIITLNIQSQHLNYDTLGKCNYCM